MLRKSNNGPGSRSAEPTDKHGSIFPLCGLGPGLTSERLQGRLHSAAKGLSQSLLNVPPHDSQTPPDTHTLLKLKSRVSTGHQQWIVHWENKLANSLHTGQGSVHHRMASPARPPQPSCLHLSQPSSVLRAEFPMFTQKRLKQVHHRWTRNGHKHPWHLV